MTPERRAELKAMASRIWREWIRVLLIVIAVVGSFRSAIADWNDVPSGSMRPTILEGDRIFVNKLAYDLKLPFTRVRLADWGDPRRGDIVVLFSPADGKRLVKRVVGLPGDVLAMRQDRVFINGRPLAYERLTGEEVAQLTGAGEGRILAFEHLGEQEHVVMITPGVPALRTFGPLRVPDGQYFLMGDNRDESGDSRYFGFVPGELIVGRAEGIAASVDPDRYFLPRWRRFFSGLN